MLSHDLASGSVLVTGASGMLGRAIVVHLVRAGYPVIAQSRSWRPEISSLLEAEGASLIQSDLSDLEACADLFAVLARSDSTQPIALVHCAWPRTTPAMLEQITSDMIADHLRGFELAVMMTRAAVGSFEHRRVSGRIVLLSGALSQRVFPGFSLYSATTAAVTAFARTVAIEAGEHGIRVNVIAPGQIDRAAEGEEPRVDSAFTRLEHISKLRRGLPVFPSPEHIANLAEFLVSDRSAALSGQVLYAAAAEPI